MGEAIFMVLVSWQSLADISALKKEIALSRINGVAFFLYAQGLLARESQCASLFTQ